MWCTDCDVVSNTLWGVYVGIIFTEITSINSFHAVNNSLTFDDSILCKNTCIIKNAAEDVNNDIFCKSVLQTYAGYVLR